MSENAQKITLTNEDETIDLYPETVDSNVFIEGTEEDLQTRLKKVSTFKNPVPYEGTVFRNADKLGGESKEYFAPEHEIMLSTIANESWKKSSVGEVFNQVSSDLTNLTWKQLGNRVSGTNVVTIPNDATEFRIARMKSAIEENIFREDIFFMRNAVVSGNLLTFGGASNGYFQCDSNTSFHLQTNKSADGTEWRANCKYDVYYK